MKKFYFTLLTLIICFWSGYAQSGVDESNIIFDFGAPIGNEYFNLFNSGNPNFNGTNFGNKTCNDTFILNGAQQLTHKCGDHNISYSELSYSIALFGDPHITFNNVEIFYESDLITSDYCSNASTDQNWETIGANINILDGLAPGTYEIQVFTRTVYESLIDGNGTHFVSNFGNNFTATFTVLADTTPPTLNGVPANTIAECDAVLAPPAVTANDNCDTTLSVSYSETSNTVVDGVGTIVREWSVTDNGGNTTTQTQTITVEDNTPPTLVGVPANTIAECDAVLAPPAVTANDNCDTTLSVSYSETSNTVVDGVGTIVREWSVTDNGGNTTTQTQTITVEDNTPPTLVGVPANTIAECDAVLAPPAVTANDNCDTTLSVSYSETSNTVVDGVGTIVREWSVTDNGGNTTTQTQTITVEDNTPPTLVGVPANTIAECDAVLAPPAVTANDNCDTTLSVSYSETSNTVVDGVGTIVREWSVTDNGGNTTTQTQTITIEDNTPPTLVGVPANTIAECDAVLAPPAVTANDNCDTTLSVSYSETSNTVVDGVGTIVREWSVTDNGGNTTTQTQTITVEDNTPPTLVGVPANTIAECDAVLAPPAVTANDNCDTTLSVSYSETSNTVVDGVGTIVREWSVTDNGGNTTTQTQTITVEDNTPPTLVGVPANTIAECDAVLAPPAVTANDNCDTTLSVSYSETSNTVVDGVGTIVREWSVTDNGGNTTTQTQTITVEDNTPPTLVGVPANTIAECDAVLAPPAVTANDNCDTTLSVSYSETSNTVVDGVGTIVREWSVTDNGGNTTTQTQTITVEDNTPPTLVGVPANTIAECDAVLAPPAVTANDNCDTTLSVSYSETSNTVVDGVGTIVREWSVTDNGGNTTTQTQTITVEDNTPPTLVGVPANTIAECDAVLAPPAVTANDNCDTTLSVSYSETSNTVVDGVGTIVREWSVTDNGGNTTTQTQTITVEDNTPPTLVGVPANTIAECDAVLAPPAVTANDNCDTTLSVSYSETSNTVVDGVGTIVREWSVTDNGGNTTTQTQTITVEDNTPPTLVGVPANTIAECDAVLAPPAVTANDNCDTTLSVSYSETSNTVVDGVGTIVREWSVTDNGGNTTTQTQTITVEDNTPPTLVGVPANTIAECDAVLAPPAVTANDNCDTTLSVSYSETSNTVVDGVGTIVREWSVTDNGGNTTTQTQTITVEDNTPPTLVGVPANTIAECDAVLAPPAVTANDNCDTTLSVSYSETSNTVVDGVGTIVREWSVTDNGGNTTTQTQTITVEDNTPPTLVGVPANTIAECDAVLAPPAVTANDNCDTTLSVSYSETSNTVVDGVGTIVREWSVTDNGGNTTTQTQTITVEDNTPPTLVGVPANTIAECDAVLAPPAVTANDNCDTTLSVSYSETSNTVVDGVGTIVREWSVTDNGGNTTTQTQTITVEDNTPPTLVGVPANTIAECDAVLAPPAVTANDNCDTTLSVSYSETSNTVVDGVGTIVREWSVTDNGGNTTTQTQTITVEDNTPPTLVGVPANTIAECDAVLAPPAVTANDNCDTTLSVSYSETSNTVVDGVGTIVREWSVTDNGGNTTTQTQTITVEDNTPPVITCPSNVTGNTSDDGTGNCTTTVNLGTPTGSDNCTNSGTISFTARVGGTIINPSTYAFPIGNTTVVWTATDVNGNTSNGCNQTVTISDNEDPVLNASPNQNVNLLGSSCQIVIPNVSGTATDNCTNPVTITQSPAQGAVVSATHNNPVTVTVTATDASGNTDIETVILTPRDVTLPTISCPSNITVTNDSGVCGANVTYVSPTFNDNCSGATMSQTAGLASGSTFPVGTTTNTFVVTDLAGNTRSCSFTVTVTDNQPPVLNPAPNQNVNLNASCQILVPDVRGTATDNCTNPITITQVPAQNLPVGATHNSPITITVTATDAAGNQDIETVIVTPIDVTAPTISCPGNQSVNFDASCQFILADYSGLASSSDNCDTNVTITQSPAVGTLLSGATTVTLTATDNAGNSDINSSCSFQVIPNDITPPNAVCQDITVSLGVTGSVNIIPTAVDGGSSDTCGPVFFSISDSNFTCADIGANTVTLTVSDNSGNTSSCIATVTVVDDTAPTMQCNNFVVVINPLTQVATINANDIDNGSNDACGLSSLTVSPNTFDTTQLGDNTVTLTATDTHGNSNTCTAIVTVEPPINEDTILTGTIVNPLEPGESPLPPSALIEATACPGGITAPRDIDLTLQAADPTTYNLQANQVIEWQISQDNGETWNVLPSSAGTLSYTLTNISDDTFIRVRVYDANDPTLQQFSSQVFIRFLPPDEPPVLTSDPRFDICLGESVLLTAESFFDQPNGQFGEGGEFNYAQPDGWRVNYVDGDFPASGDNGREEDWKETNSNNNALFSNINYDTADNTKFALAHGVGNTTQLETPVFSTIGMTSAEAIMTFDTSFFFCNGGYGTIWLSFDSGVTYAPANELTAYWEGTNTPINFTTGNDTGIHVTKQGNCNSANSQRASTDPRMTAAYINLGPYVGLSGLRVRFEFFGSTSTCTNVAFPPAPGNNCNPVRTFDVASGWAIDNVGFAYAGVDDELEWTDEEGNVIAIGSQATVQPITPGIRNYGVTNLVNGCRAPGEDGTNDDTLVYTSLAYAGPDYIPSGNQCGENFVQLRAYDNTIKSRANYALGNWETGLYDVPVDDASDYDPTGVGGQWTIVNSTTTSCGNLATFSSNTDPNASFNASPGTYTLRWTLNDGSGCFDDVVVTVVDCPTIDFDGINDHIDFRNHYNFDSTYDTDGHFSIEVWVKPNSVNGTKTVFSRKDDAVNTAGYALTVVDGQVRFNWYKSAGSGSITSGGLSIGTDRWYHLAVTFNGSEYLMYVDGILISTQSGLAPDATPNNIKALLGATDQAPPNEATKYFHGWMDELRIWTRALDVQHIRQMMNQEINASGANVMGTVIPTKIYGPDTNADGVEDDPLLWSELEGYYRMNVACGDFSPYKGVAGRLRNIQTSQQETAPLPYTSRANSSWDTDNTWTFFSVWDVPNSIGIDGTPIDWNIVRTTHNISTNTRNLTVLGLLVDSNKLTVTDLSGGQDENNNGVGLWVTDYLKLNGEIDLVGESQLVQKRISTRQFNESILDVASAGNLERDQQGTTNLFNYNYFSSPVGRINTAANNVPENLVNLLLDGTVTTNNPHPVINWTSSYNATGTINPITLSNRWIYAYENFPFDNYASWNYKGNTGTLDPGYGFTMKGSGVGVGAEGDIITGGNQLNGIQNYVFKGKPNNQDIIIPITSWYQALVGNPYPSAIDSHEFIDDNIPIAQGGNIGSGESTEGTLYFWEHYTSNQTHILEEYEGGYAVLNKSGGLPVYEPALISGNGASTKTPGRYVPVGQGFFVGSVFNYSGNVKFENDQRVFQREGVGNSVFLRNGNTKTKQKSTKEVSNSLRTIDAVDSQNEELVISRVRLNFTSHIDGKIRPLLLAFTSDNSATDGVDYGYDASNTYFQNNDAFFIVEDGVYVVQGVGAFDEEKRYPLGIFLSENSDVEVALTDLENFDEAIDVFIYDALLDTYTKLNGTNFESNLDPDYYFDRFFITFKESSTLKDDEILKDDFAYVAYLDVTKDIYIKLPTANVTQVKLISVLGQTVRTWDTGLEAFYSNAYRIPVSGLPIGTYILNVETETTTISKKVIIK